MTALSIIAVLHLLFFPGFLIRRWIRFPKNFFIHVACITATSLIFNYLLVFFLTSLHVFIPWVSRGIILIEIFLIIFIYRKEIFTINLQDICGEVWNRLTGSLGYIFKPVEPDQQKNFQLSSMPFFLSFS